MMPRKSVFLASACCAVMLVAFPASAQDAAAPVIPSVPAEGLNAGITDIIVTAQRRQESSQDVPISITAVDASALATARVDNVSNIDAITPSVNFRVSNNATSSANLIIRGLGTTGNSRSFEGSVGVFIDGVYRTRAAAALQNFLDIGGLQVLRGPQGTLFGKNTTAGALLLASTAPETGRAAGSVEASYGNYDAVVVRAAATIPLGDAVAMRMAVMHASNDGFYTDSTTGDDLSSGETQAIKGQLLYDAGTGFTARIIADYSRQKTDCCYAAVDLVNGPVQPLIDGLTRAGGLTVPSKNFGDYEATINSIADVGIKDYGVTLLVDAEIGAGTLSAISAYRKFVNNQRNADADFTGAAILSLDETFDSRFLSQELTYNVKIDAINADLVLGAFLSDETLTMERGLDHLAQAQPFWDGVLLALRGLPPGTANAAPGLLTSELMTGSANSYAVFAHMETKLTDRISVVTGLRYSIEEKQGTFRQVDFAASLRDPFRLLAVLPGPDYSARQTDKALSGTFAVQYFATRDLMAYASYNRGFKAGGVNMDNNGGGTRLNNPAEVPGATPLDPRYRPETINAYEIGLKADYLNRRARTNISLFHYDVSDIQVAQFVGLRFVVLNGQRAKVWGAEIENLFELTEGVTLGLDATWLPTARFLADPALDVALSGQRFRYAPAFKGNATLLIDRPVSDSMNLTGRLQYQYSGEQFIGTASTYQRDAISLLNANLGVRFPDSGLQIEAWALNLTDEVYPDYALSTPLQNGDQNAFMGAPRTYGVRARIAF